MTSPPLQTVVRQLREIVGGPPPSELPDRELLGQFVESKDEAAFREIVRRHGPLVLGACRRVLQRQHDAEDAFQATFVVLARRAAQVRWQDSVGTWLYEVALRISLKARSQAGTRQLHERQAGEMSRAETVVEPNWSDFPSALDEELARLPAKFRQPLVLCYMQGKTRDEAARELGWSEGAVKGSLERGREMLRQRLASRGVALSAALFAVALSSGPASAAVPAPLVASTVQAILVGPGAAGVSAHVAALTEGALQTMAVTKLKIAAALLLTLGVAGAGVGALAHHALAERPAATPATEFADQNNDIALAADEKEGQKKPEADQEKKPEARQADLGRANLTGKIAEVAKDGKSVVLELPRKKEDDPLTKIEIKFTERTKYSYIGIGENNAAGRAPTAGYFAKVWLAEGTKDTAVGIQLSPREFAVDGDRPRNPENADKPAARPPTASGTVVELDAAKNTITVSVGVRDNFFEDKTFALPADVKIQAGRNVNLTRADLKKGVRVSLVLTEDKKTVTIVRVAVPDGEK